MTLISSIISDAFRESNILALGRDPSVNQGAEALRLYNSLLASLYGTQEGERFQDWPLGDFDRNPDDPWFRDLQYLSDRELDNPPINQRLLATNTVARTVWLTPRPQDGARYAIADPYGRLAAFPVTLGGNGRPIEGAASIVLNVNSTFREWIYRSDLAAWVKISPVIATDENPFPPQFDIMFVILLAMRINPRYGRTLDAQSVAALKDNKQDFRNRYLQSRPLEILDDISWPFMSVQGYDSQRSFSTTRGFERGNPFGD
ncbi:MAG: hypothetical protein H0X34_07170 [Chthoniobacterales bacterium]|nr:hypothetical protein [Chthoniobacterales bacterium]